MKCKKVIWVTIICIVTILLGGLCTVYLYCLEKPEDVFRIPEMGIVIVSFIIAFVGFVISMLTFFVIDSLQSVTSMDGNVLDNEHYSIAYEELVDNFAECDTRKKFTDKLFESVKPKRRIESCMKFADELQTIVDHLIWFAYVDFNDDVIKECDKICKIIRKKKERFDKLSNGLNRVLEEYVKLIEYVLKYQQNRNREENFRVVKLENIRGDMLKNPIAKIVYYDYLGLHYRRKALEVLKRCGSSKRDCTAEFMQAVKSYSYAEKDLEEYRCLINRAKESFDRAQNLSGTNILWSGYISYNLLRVDVMNCLVMKENSYTQIIQKLDYVIRTRKDMLFLFERKGSYLNQQFEDEVERAVCLKKEFMKVGERRCAVNGHCKVVRREKDLKEERSEGIQFGKLLKELCIRWFCEKKVF